MILAFYWPMGISPTPRVSTIPNEDNLTNNWKTMGYFNDFLDGYVRPRKTTSTGFER
jgi:hypothetical protein